MAKKHSTAQKPDRMVEPSDSAHHDEPPIPTGEPSQAGLALLVQRLRAGRVVLCTGSIFGRQAASASFRTLLGKLLAQHSDKLGSDEERAQARALLESQPLLVAGLLRKRLGDDLVTALAKVLPSDSNSQLLGLAAKLPFRGLISTALDGGLMDAVSQGKAPGGPPHVGTSEQTIEMLSSRGRFVLRLFGDGSTGQGLVFGEADVQQLFTSEPLRQSLRDLALKRSLLLCGFDAHDPDLAIAARLLSLAQTSGEGPQHFALLPGLPPGLRDELSRAYGLIVLDADSEEAVFAALHQSVGEIGSEILPDDDDLEGWLRLLQQEPEHQVATQKLADLEETLRGRGDHDRLIELFLGRMDIEKTPSGRARCLLQVASLFETAKGQLVESYHAALAAYKEDPQTVGLDEVERLAGQAGQWVELLTEMRDLTPRQPKNEQAVLWLRIARLYGDKLNHHEYALASLAEAQKLGVPDSEKKSFATLRVELCRRAQRWKDLADTLGQLAELTDEKDKRVDLYLEQGEIFETRLSDGAASVTAYKLARTTDPQSRDAMLALEHTLRRAASWTDLIALLDEKAGLLTEHGDVEGVLKTRREAAQLQAEHGTDRRASIRRWEEVHKLAPDDLDVLRSLERLYSMEGSVSEAYLKVLSDLATLVPSDKERLSLYRRLAAEYEEMPGQLDSATDALQKVLDLDAKAEDAYRSLCRIYRQQKKWTELCRTYERHIEHADKGKSELLTALARVYEVEIPAGDELRRREEAPLAIAAWQQILDSEPEHMAAIEALGRLYQLTDKPVEAVRLLVKRAHLTDDKNLKVTLYGEAARLCQSKLEDLTAAEEHLVRALEILPGHVQSLTTLAELYRGRGDHLRAAKLFKEAAEGSSNRLDKARYMVLSAKEHLLGEERHKAGELLREVLAQDPEHNDAAQLMSELYWQDGRFDDALPLLEMLTRKEAERGTQVVRLTRLAQASLGAGLRDKARRAYRRALELEPKDLGALRGLLPLLVETGQFVDARQISETLVTEHHDALGPSEEADLLATLGQAEMSLGNSDAALTALQKARALTPMHRQALAQLRRVEQLSPEDKLEVRQSLLRSLLGQSGEPGTTDERMTVLTEIGDLYAGPLAKPLEAIASYKEALSLSPKAVAIQHKLLSLYTEQKLWPEAADLLQELAAAESNEKRRARYKQTAGFITRDHLQEPRRALRLLWSSFDDDPTLLKSLESAETLAAQIGDPKELLRAMQRRIKVMGPEAPDTPKQRAERLRLWTEVARVCIQEMGDFKTGMSAYEVSLTLEPHNLDRHRQMAAIYASAGEDKLDKAIAEHHVVLRHSKGELASYRALRELYGQTGQRERATQVAAALQLLRQGEPEDAQLVEELKSRPVTLARRPLTKELWRQLAHPDEDARMQVLLSLLWPALQKSHARPWSEQPFLRESRVEASASQVYLKALRYAFEMTESPLPELFPRPQARELAEQAFLISIAGDGRGPATVCAELGPPLLDPSRPERETLYEVGRMAALLRPERALRTVLSDEQELGQILEAALVLTQQEISQVTPPASAQVLELARSLRAALSPPQLDQLSRVGRSLLDGAGVVKPSLLASTWLSASELTTVRVGLLLCGELETAALLLATDPPGLTLLSPKQRLQELLYFSVSEELASVRQFLGL